jgi:Domain of Unknown Function with PDB structure (DUF3857)/Transglutaminase-like superfamily
MPRWRSLGHILVLCLSSLSLVPKLPAQVSDGWQPIPKDDLALKDNPADPGSAAMILERQIYTDDEKRVQTEWVRIKVFTEAGRAYADVEIPYLVKSTSVEDIRGRTVRSDGTVIPFSGAVFEKVVARYKKYRYEAETFTLPGVEVGSIIEYSFSVRWKERIPDYVSNPSGYIFPHAWTIPTTTWTVQQGLFTRHAVFVIRPVKGGPLNFAKVRLNDNLPSWQSDGTMRMEVNNVAAIEKEDRMPPESMLNSRVHFYYTVGIVGDYGQYWRTIGQVRAENAQKLLEKTRFLEQTANSIAPPGDPPETRLRKLYARVQQVRYLSYEPRRTEKEDKREHLTENKSAEDILRHNYAYANEINYLFTALARSAGFDATILEVVNRSSAIFEPQVLDTSQLNAMVVLVRLKGVNLYFDPATRFCPYGVVPWFESGTVGLQWEKLGGDIVKVQSPANEAGAIEHTAELKLKPDGSLEGSLEIVFTGQEALDRRLAASDEDEEGRRKLMEDEIKELTPPGAVIDLDTVTGWLDSEQPLRVKCHLHAARFAAFTHERMLFPLAVFQANRKNPFIQAYRVQPVYFQRGYREIDKITISIPEGYRLEALPSDTENQAPFATFHTKRTGEAALLRLDRQAEMTGYYFQVQSYGLLREYFEKLRQSDAENVVLHKVDSAQAH